MTGAEALRIVALAAAFLLTDWIINLRGRHAPTE